MRQMAGQPVTVCGTTDGVKCSANGWANRVVMFADNDSSQLIKPAHILDARTVSGSAVKVVASVISLTFSPSSEVNRQGVILVCDDRGDAFESGIFVSSIGTVLSLNDGDGNGVLDMPPGQKGIKCQH